MECQYIQSTICPGCLKDFHTTWRAQQHLKFRPNLCWDRIHGARAPGELTTIVLPAHLKHVKRLPATRKHHGPLRPTSSQRHRTQLRERIVALRAKGKADYAWWCPESNPELAARVCDAFDEALHAWCAKGEPDEIDLQSLTLKSQNC